MLRMELLASLLVTPALHQSPPHRPPLLGRLLTWPGRAWLSGRPTWKASVDEAFFGATFRLKCLQSRVVEENLGNCIFSPYSDFRGCSCYSSASPISD